MYHNQNIPHEDPQKSSYNINNTNTHAYSNTLTKYSQKYIVPAQVSFNELSPSNEFNLHKKNFNSISQDQSSYFLHDKFFNKQNHKEHEEQFRDRDQEQENTLARLLMFDSDDFGTVENGHRNGISRQQQSPLSINASLDNNKPNISNPIKYVNSRYETYPDPEYENDAFSKVKKQQNNISSNNVVQQYKPLTNPNLVNYAALPLYQSQYQFNRLPLSSVESLQQQPVKVYEETYPGEGNFKKKHYFEQEKQEDFYHGIETEDQKYETQQSQDELFKFIIKLLEILNKKIKAVSHDSFQAILRNGPLIKMFQNKNYQLHSRKEDQIINKYIKFNDAQLKYSIAKDIENPNIPLIHPQSISSFQIQASHSSSSLPYTISTSINEPLQSSKRKQVFTIEKKLDEAQPQPKFSSTHPTDSKLITNQEQLQRYTINAYPFNHYGAHHKNQAIFPTFNKIVEQSQQQSNANTNSNIGSFHSGIPQFQFNSKLKAKTKVKKKGGIDQNEQIKIRPVESMQMKQKQKYVNQFPKFQRQTPIPFQANSSIVTFKNLSPLLPDDSIKAQIQDKQIQSQQSCHFSYGFIDSENLCSNSNDDFIDGSEQEVLPVYEPQNGGQSQNNRENEQSCNLYVDSNTKKNGISSISSQVLKNSLPPETTPVANQISSETNMKNSSQINNKQKELVIEQENEKSNQGKIFGSDINSDKEIITSSIQQPRYIQQDKAKEENVHIKNAVSFIHIRSNQNIGNSNFVHQNPTIIVKNPHIRIPVSPANKQEGVTVRFTSTSPVRNKQRVASAYTSPPRDMNYYQPKIILQYNNEPNLRRDQPIILRPYSQPNLRSLVSMKKNIDQNFNHPRMIDPNKKVIQVRSNYYGQQQRVTLPIAINLSPKPQGLKNYGEQYKIIHSDKNVPIRPKSPSYQYNHQNIVTPHYQILPSFQQIGQQFVSPKSGSSKHIVAWQSPQQRGQMQNQRFFPEQKNIVRQIKVEKKAQKMVKQNFNRREQEHLDQTFITKLNMIQDNDKNGKIREEKKQNNIIRIQKSPHRYSPYMDTHVIPAKDKPNSDNRNIQTATKQSKQPAYKPPFGFASPHTHKNQNIIEKTIQHRVQEQKLVNTPIRYQNSLSPQNKPLVQQMGQKKVSDINKGTNPLYQSYHDYDYLYSNPNKAGSRKKLNLVSKEEDIRKSQYKNY